MIGDATIADENATLAREIASLAWATWADHVLTTQTGCAVALQFDIVPESDRVAVADALAHLVRAGDGRVATGFLGTPLVLPALASVGKFDEAYLMLLRRDVPSWLYQVAQGATTVWERWDAILPDGSIHSGQMSTPPDMPEGSEAGEHMLSFNHYAYGAVIDWVYRTLAGIAPDRARPGYSHVVFAPRPVAGIDHVRASVDSAYGRVAIEWRLADDTLIAEVNLPFGTSADFHPPLAAELHVTVDGARVAGAIHLGPGRHELVIERPDVADGSGLGQPTRPAAVGAAEP